MNTAPTKTEPNSPPDDALGWVRTWGASPQAPDSSVSSVDPFENATLRQNIRVSGGGRRIRIRLSNEYGSVPLTIGNARVGVAETDHDIRANSDCEVTFSSRATATIPPGAPLVSDPIDLEVAALSQLTISLYIPGRVDAVTCHGTFHALGWSIPGDATSRASLPSDATPLQAQALITAVEIQSDIRATAIAVLGDSRVDGVGSRPGADGRWTDLLAKRLHAQGSLTRCVVNQGISGNRLLSDGIGTSGLSRFDRDILATPGLRHVVIAVGNDLVFSFAPKTEENMGFLEMFPGGTVSIDDILDAHRQLAARARMQGLKVLVATIAPYGESEMYSAEGDEARMRINAWIRTSDVFDGVLDFDAVWRDPASPHLIQDGLHMGDHLHGSDDGYSALADSIDLSLFY